MQADSSIQKPKRFHSKYPFRMVTRYIPKRYEGLQDWQLENREAVERFKHGNLTEAEMQKIVKLVKRIIAKGEDTDKWIITYIPASTRDRYIKKYFTLTRYLRKHLEVPVAYFGVSILDEGKCKHEGGRKVITSDNLIIKRYLLPVRKKNIILIDDVITTGESFRTVGDFLKAKGANSIFGLFYAMTIHPNLPEKTNNVREMKKIESSP